jgi:hypothetical protein
MEEEVGFASGDVEGGPIADGALMRHGEVLPPSVGHDHLGGTAAVAIVDSPPNDR